MGWGGVGRGNLPEGVFHYCHDIIRNAALKNGDLKVRKSREPGQPRVRNSIWPRPLLSTLSGSCAPFINHLVCFLCL